jgi:hypothetical protein
MDGDDARDFFDGSFATQDFIHTIFVHKLHACASHVGANLFVTGA